MSIVVVLQGKEGTVLAADDLITSSGDIWATTPKIFQLNKTLAVGLCGSLYAVQSLLTFFENYTTLLPENKLKEDCLDKDIHNALQTLDLDTVRRYVIHPLMKYCKEREFLGSDDKSPLMTDGNAAIILANPTRMVAISGDFVVCQPKKYWVEGCGKRRVEGFLDGLDGLFDWYNGEWNRSFENMPIVNGTKGIVALQHLAQISINSACKKDLAISRCANVITLYKKDLQTSE